jgi:hypothetical protein
MEAYINIFQDDEVGYCLTVTDTDDRTYALFEEMELQGGGYTWEGIVTALAEMRMPEAVLKLRIGAEADNMYVYCPDRAVLERLAQLRSGFKTPFGTAVHSVFARFSRAPTPEKGVLKPLLIRDACADHDLLKAAMKHAGEDLE